MTHRKEGGVSTALTDQHLLGLSVLLANDTEVRFSRDDPPYWSASTLTLHTVYFDTRRTIHMDDPATPGEQPPSHLGFSAGRCNGRAFYAQ